MTKVLRWVDNAHPAVNLLVTAGFHSVFTLACGLFGLSGEAAFGYLMKEGGPFARSVVTWDFRRYLPYERSLRGWTTVWMVADSIADVLGPALVHFLLF